jgi:hypothetical protein
MQKCHLLSNLCQQSAAKTNLLTEPHQNVENKNT